MTEKHSPMSPETKDGIPAFHASNPAEWRQWLEINHATQEAVWLIGYRKNSGVACVAHSDAVDEALCFGWIDSKRNSRDDQSFYQFFSRRKPKSAWSKVNKAKVERLIAAGKMAPAGLKVIELAKGNGTWNFLDEIEEEVMPIELEAAFAENPSALTKFQTFPPSTRKAIFHWIIQAKTVETRTKRIIETVSKAALGERANEWKRPHSK